MSGARAAIAAVPLLLLGACRKDTAPAAAGGVSDAGAAASTLSPDEGRAASAVASDAGRAASAGVASDSGPAASAAPSLDVAARPAEPPVLRVPRASRPIVPTGHFNVDAWAGAVSTHTLLDAAGKGAVPVSEARFLWGSGQLYVFFYAGDLDLQAHAKRADGPVWNDDSVALTFARSDGTKRIVQISVTGVVADGKCPADARDLADARCDLSWQSGARVGVDSDGTLNRIGDRDEEWAVEAAIPLVAIGARAGARVPFALSRQEIAHDGPRQRGAWGEGHGGDDGPANVVGALILEDAPAAAPAIARRPPAP